MIQEDYKGTSGPICANLGEGKIGSLKVEPKSAESEENLLTSGRH